MNKWQNMKLGDILKESKIESLYPNSSRRIRVRLNLEGVEQRPDQTEKVGATKYYLRKANQFIYGRQNLHKGAFGIIPAYLDGFESSADLPAFDVAENCYPEWIYYFFKQNDFYSKLDSLAKGIGSKRINSNQLANLQISVPSKEKQREILDAVKVFESDTAAFLKELEKQKLLIENMKVAFLSEAMNGDHSKQWRELQSSKLPEATLLSENGRTNAYDPKLKIKRGNFIKNDKSYPNNWLVRKLGDYVTCERGRFSARPRNDPRYFNGDIPYIQIGDLPANGGILNKHTQTLNEQGLTVSKLFPKGTIAIAIVGGTIGNTGILGYPMCFPDSLVGIKPTSNFNTEFIEYFLRSKKGYFRDQAYSGGGQPNIKLPTINNCEILIPPILEQNEIVNKLNSFFLHCNTLTENINSQILDVKQFLKLELGKIWGISNELPPNFSQMPKIEIRTYQKLLDTVKHYGENESDKDDIVDILSHYGKMSAVGLWQLSKHVNNIDDFYSQLKILIDEKKLVKESEEKGYLELV